MALLVADLVENLVADLVAEKCFCVEINFVCML